MAVNPISQSNIKLPEYSEQMTSDFFIQQDYRV